jgi:hypothetical protein
MEEAHIEMSQIVRSIVILQNNNTLVMKMKYKLAIC